MPLLVWWVVCLIWSTVWLAIKIGVRDTPPISFAALRLAIAVAVLTPVAVMQRSAIRRGLRDIILIAGTGVLLLGVNYACVYWGAQYISSGLTAVLHASTPAFALVVAPYYIPGERVTVRAASAISLGVVGVGVIFSNQLESVGTNALLGSTVVVVGAACVAWAYVLVKAYGSHLHPVRLMVGQMLCAAVPLFAVAFTREGNPFTFRWTTPAVAALLYLALAGSVAAFWLNYWLLRRMDASKVLFMSIVEPVFAVALGVAVLGESLTAPAVMGTLLILLSAWLALSQGTSATVVAEA